MTLPRVKLKLQFSTSKTKKNTTHFLFLRFLLEEDKEKIAKLQNFPHLLPEQKFAYFGTSPELFTVFMLFRDSLIHLVDFIGFRMIHLQTISMTVP